MFIPFESGLTAPPMDKPLHLIEQLFSIFLPHAIPTPLKRRDIGSLNLHDKNNEKLFVALVTEGTVNVHHRSNMMLLGTAQAPFIFGLQGSMFQYELFRLMPEENCKISLLSREDALKLIIKHQAMQQVLTYQTYVNDYQANRNHLLINRTSVHIVCGLLFELSKIPPEKRSNISVAKYIMSRSTLARSGVMKIISNLREEGYITVHNGKLVELIKPLSEKNLPIAAEIFEDETL